MEPALHFAFIPPFFSALIHHCTLQNPHNFPVRLAGYPRTLEDNSVAVCNTTLCCRQAGRRVIFTPPSSSSLGKAHLQATGDDHARPIQAVAAVRAGTTTRLQSARISELHSILFPPPPPPLGEGCFGRFLHCETPSGAAVPGGW